MVKVFGLECDTSGLSFRRGLLIFWSFVTTSRSSRIVWKLIGSLGSALIGAVAGVLAMVVMGWEDWRTCLLMISLFVVPVWLLVLLPLHILLPRSSLFWDPGVSVGVGGVSGAILLTGYSIFVSADLLWLFAPVGALVGTVTGLAGAVFARRYGPRKG